MNMSIEGHAMHLFRILGISTRETVDLLRPFNGVMPQTEQQYKFLQTQIRRNLRISEHAPGNIGEYLHGNAPTRTHTYLTNTDPTGTTTDDSNQQIPLGGHLFGSGEVPAGAESTEPFSSRHY